MCVRLGELVPHTLCTVVKATGCAVLVIPAEVFPQNTRLQIVILKGATLRQRV